MAWLIAQHWLADRQAALLLSPSSSISSPSTVFLLLRLSLHLAIWHHLFCTSVYQFAACVEGDKSTAATCFLIVGRFTVVRAWEWRAEVGQYDYVREVEMEQNNKNVDWRLLGTGRCGQGRVGQQIRWHRGCRRPRTTGTGTADPAAFGVPLRFKIIQNGRTCIKHTISVSSHT